MTQSAVTFANSEQADSLARKLYPAAKSFQLVEHGYDNIVVLVDESFALRFPRNKDAAIRSQYEKLVLQHLGSVDMGVEFPHLIGERSNPPCLITSFVSGEHLSSEALRQLPPNLQEELGNRVARFAYAMHTALPVDQALKIRDQIRIDEIPDETWEAYFEHYLAAYTFPTPEQDRIAKEYYARWKALPTSPQVVVHDDLHTENMLFKENRLSGVLDFGDTNIGIAEQELRQLYRISDLTLQAAVDTYSQLAGRELSLETVKVWAITQELGAYASRYAHNDTTHPTVYRAVNNLNQWLCTDAWKI